MGKTGINPGVKKFAYIGLAIVIFSVFYKHGFRIGGIVDEITQAIDKLLPGEKKKDKTKTEKKGIEPTELLNVMDYQGPEDPAEYKELVIEGIFFDPERQSFVVINGQVIPEGKKLYNGLIKKINKESVELVIDNVTKILKVDDRLPLVVEEEDEF